MSVDANTGNAFLDSYARQINRLERDPNATAANDAALEKQFNEIKAQVLGDSGPASGSGKGGPGSTHGSGSRSSGSSMPATGSSSGTTAPPVADSIDKITSTAGPAAAANVQKIADGAAASIGGSAGASVAATAAQAGVNAAQHVIDSGGTPTQAGAAAQTAAQAVAAGAAGGPAAATNVGRVSVIADPATAQAVANTAAGVAKALGGGVVGAAGATAVTLAGSNAAAVAAATGASTADIAAAATAAASAASSAATAVLGAGGTAADATAVAAAVANAAGFGGAAAAESVAAAAASGDVAGAQAAAQAAEAAASAAGGAAAAEAAATAAKDAAFAAQRGGGSAAQSVADAAAHGGVASADDVAIAVSMVTSMGGSAADGAAVARLVANAAEQGGAAFADEITPVINMIALSRGSVADMTQVAGDITKAFTAGGVDAAHVVSDSARQAFERMAGQVLDGGGSADEIRDIVNEVSDAAVTGGEALAKDVSSVINTVVEAGGSAANINKAAVAVTKAFNAGGANPADAVVQSAQAASSSGVAGIEDATSVAAEVAAAGGSAADIQKAANDVTRVFRTKGADAAEAVVTAAQKASAAGVTDMTDFVDVVNQAALKGGAPLANDVAQVSTMVSLSGGTGTAMTQTASAITNTFTRGGQQAADAALSAVADVYNAGGRFDAIRDISNTFAEQVERESLDNGRAAAGQFAGQLAREIHNFAGGRGGWTDMIATAMGLDGDDMDIFVAVPPSSMPGARSFGLAVPPNTTPPELTTIVATASGDPIPLNPVGPAVNAYAKLLNDLQSGADQSTIHKDAQQLAIVAAAVNDGTLEKVALLVGSGKYGSNAINILKAASPEQADQDNVYSPPVTDPLGGMHSPLNDAYLQLEVDIAGGADQKAIKADADNVAQLAGGSGQSGLALAASNISNSVTDSSYNQGGSLAALMNNPPTLSPTVPVPTPPPSPSDSDAYQKLLNDIQSGADVVTIMSDAAQLAVAAAGNGDAGLEYVARNIGNSIGNGSYSKDGSVAALTDAASGTSGAKGSPQGPFAQANDTGSAYLKLERDVESGADSQTLKADAEQVKTSAEKDGNSNLVAAADAVISGIGNNTSSQVGAEEALMNDGATNIELGFGPPAGSSQPNETTAYQKLLTDIRSGADSGTITKDVLALSSDAIKTGDFGLSQVAIDIGFSIQDDKFDPAAALKSLTGAAPGTAAAQLPPIPG